MRVFIYSWPYQTQPCQFLHSPYNQIRVYIHVSYFSCFHYSCQPHLLWSNLSWDPHRMRSNPILSSLQNKNRLSAWGILDRKALWGREGMRHSPQRTLQILCSAARKELLHRTHPGLVNSRVSFSTGGPEAWLGPCVQPIQGIKGSPDNIAKECFSTDSKNARAKQWESHLSRGCSICLFFVIRGSSKCAGSVKKNLHKHLPNTWHSRVFFSWDAH